MGGPRLWRKPLPACGVARNSRALAVEQAGAAVPTPPHACTAAARGSAASRLSGSRLPPTGFYGKVDGSSRAAGNGANAGKRQRYGGAVGPAGHCAVGMRRVAEMLPWDKGIYTAAQPLCCNGGAAAGGIRGSAAVGGDTCRVGGLCAVRSTLPYGSGAGSPSGVDRRPQCRAGQPHGKPADPCPAAGTGSGGAAGSGTDRLLGYVGGVRSQTGGTSADYRTVPYRRTFGGIWGTGKAYMHLTIGTEETIIY